MKPRSALAKTPDDFLRSEMTMRYAHLSPETKQSAVQLLDQPAPLQRELPRQGA